MTERNVADIKEALKERMHSEGRAIYMRLVEELSGPPKIDSITLSAEEAIWLLQEMGRLYQLEKHEGLN